MQVMRVAPFAELLDGPLARPRFNAFLIGVFGIAALLLAAIGLYAVMARLRAPALHRDRRPRRARRDRVGRAPPRARRRTAARRTRRRDRARQRGRGHPPAARPAVRRATRSIRASMLAAALLLVGVSALASLPARATSRTCGSRRSAANGSSAPPVAAIGAIRRS